jgi:sugar phosphate isomerase/epimerase
MHKNKYISRRVFVKETAAVVIAASMPSMKSSSARQKTPSLRLGGPVKESNPIKWIQMHKALGYRAAYCPAKAFDPDDLVQGYKQLASKADIVIAEVGAWSNPISDDPEERKEALTKCREQLALADRIGARCCVNISGSRGNKWDGPDTRNLTDETFDLIVETTRGIIDDVKPKRTFFALETMPWAHPDSPDSYVRLIKAIDRKHFAVHLDPVNLVNSPRRYFNNAALIRECFEKLGPYIKSCHAKDIILEKKLTTHLNEIQPGLGGLDYETFLTELSKIPDTPLMLEHLKTPEQYKQAADHIRTIAKKIGLSFEPNEK